MFDQVVDPDNLARLPSEQHRTIIRLLALTGLRISSIVTLRGTLLRSAVMGIRTCAIST